MSDEAVAIQQSALRAFRQRFNVDDEQRVIASDANPAAVPVDPFGYSNVQEFGDIEGASLMLFYTESLETVLFDPDNDAALVEIFSNPFQFDNMRSLANYEALVDRAYYECRPHPNQQDIVDHVVGELPMDPDSIIVFVYKRDSASTSPVQNRMSSPFLNSINGLQSAEMSSPPLVLFGMYNHEPRLVVRLIWHDAKRANATVGTVAFELLEIL